MPQYFTYLLRAFYLFKEKMRIFPRDRAIKPRLKKKTKKPPNKQTN